MKQHGDVYLRAGACPDSDTRGMTRCWACHIPNRIQSQSRALTGVTPLPLWAAGTWPRVTGATGASWPLGPSSPGKRAPAAVTWTDSLPPPPAARPKLQAGAGEPPGFPRDPATAGWSPGALGPHTWAPSSSTVGRHGGKQVRSPEKSHGSGAHPHPRGDPAPPGQGHGGPRNPLGCKGTSRETRCRQGAPFQGCKGNPPPWGW